MKTVLQIMKGSLLFALTLGPTAGCSPETLFAGPSGAAAQNPEVDCSLLMAAGENRVAIAKDGRVLVASAPIWLSAPSRTRIEPIRFVQNGERLILRLIRDSIGQPGNRILIYDTVSGKLVVDFASEGWLNEYSPAEVYAVAVLRERGVNHRLYNLQTGSVALTTHGQYDTPNDIKAGGFNTDGTYSAIYHYGHAGAYSWIGTWDLASGRLVGSTTRPGWVTDLGAQR